jgi:hypothetical protein
MCVCDLIPHFESLLFRLRGGREVRGTTVAFLGSSMMQQDVIAPQSNGNSVIV